MQKTISTSLVSLLLAAVIGGAISGAGAVWWMTHHPTTQRFAIVNVGALAQRISGSVSPRAQDFKIAFDKLDEIGTALAAKGYIVLNSGAVVAAPDALYTPEPIQRKAPISQPQPIPKLDKPKAAQKKP